MERPESEEVRFERIARELKSAGYTGAVVSSKLISEHGMDEARAVALVSGLYGRPVNPRQGAIFLDLSVGLVELVAGGWLLSWYGVWGVMARGWIAAAAITVDGARRVLRGLLRLSVSHAGQSGTGAGGDTPRRSPAGSGDVER